MHNIVKWIVGILIVLLVLFITFSTVSCGKTKDIVGPTTYDTLTVHTTDTLYYSPSQYDFYGALQEKVKEWKPDLWFYYPAIGDTDILVTPCNKNLAVIELTFSAREKDFSVGYWYYGIFQIRWDGEKIFTVQDVTPGGAGSYLKK